MKTFFLTLIAIIFAVQTTLGVKDSGRQKQSTRTKVMLSKNFETQMLESIKAIRTKQRVAQIVASGTSDQLQELHRIYFRTREYWYRTVNGSSAYRAVLQQTADSNTRKTFQLYARLKNALKKR
jgi:hypothetical protein